LNIPQSLLLQTPGVVGVVVIFKLQPPSKFHVVQLLTSFYGSIWIAPDSFTARLFPELFCQDLFL
jgi:hypothetical protein